MEEFLKEDLQSAVEHDEKVVLVQGTRKRQSQGHRKLNKDGSPETSSGQQTNSHGKSYNKRKKTESSKTDMLDNQRNIKLRNLEKVAANVGNNESVKPEQNIKKHKKLRVRAPIGFGKYSIKRRGAIGNLFKEEDFLKNSKNARQRYFDIPDLYLDGDSSDSSGSDDEWSSLEKYSDKEQDEEWLGIEQEYKEQLVGVMKSTQEETEPVEKRGVFLGPNNQLDVGCEEYMAAMKYFWWLLNLGGRMPFQTYIEDRNIKFKLNKWSFQFVYFSLTSVFLTFCTTTMGYSFIRIFLNDTRVLNSYERIERIDVDKYWIFAVVTFAASAISSSWSLAIIFEDGHTLADFLSRWNVAISVLKYRPTTRIQLYFWLNTLMYFTYSTVVIYLFETDYVPAVKGASGLVGLTIFRPFTTEIRISRNFPHVQRFGLFVHLYAVFSSRVILLMITLYCRLLANMARKWSIRLAYVMGMLPETLTKEKVVAVISFQKLFLEHAIIVGFLRHTGRIFSVALGVFYTLKILELLVLTYSTVSLLVYNRPKFNTTEVPGTPDYLPKIMYTDPILVLLASVTFLLIHSVMEWVITTEQITTPGEAILDGFSFVRRWGLILAKTSQRRRFVLSINHAFSQASDYYVRASFTINREFTFNSFFWLSVFASLLIAFSPFQLQRELFSACNQNGTCVAVSRTRIAWRSGDSFAKPTMTMAQSEIDELPPIPGSCKSDHDVMPVLFVQLPAGCLNGARLSPYEGILSRSNCLESPKDTQLPYNFLGRTIRSIQDCSRNDSSVGRLRDSCGNLQFDNIIERKPAQLKAVKVMVYGDFWVLCCYDYGYGAQLNFCNQIFSDSIGPRCAIQTATRFLPPYKYNLVGFAEQDCIDGRNPTSTLCRKVDECFCSTTGLVEPIVPKDRLFPGAITCP